MLHAVKPFIEFYRVASFASASPPHHSLRTALRGLALGWQAATRYRRLSMMTNEELARLGLDRASIGRYAFFGDPPLNRG